MRFELQTLITTVLRSATTSPLAALQTLVGFLLFVYAQMLLQRRQVGHDHGADVTAEARHTRLHQRRSVADDVNLTRGTRVGRQLLF